MLNQIVLTKGGYICLQQPALRPSASYLSHQQSCLTSQMRSVLVDWLVEVADDFRLHTETLFLAVNYLDRFLSMRKIQREELQLLGIACLYIAAKYEEINPPHVEKFAYVTDNACNAEDIVAVEAEVLCCLHFRLSVPTSKVRLGCACAAPLICSTSHDVKKVYNHCMPDASLWCTGTSRVHLTCKNVRE